MAEPYYRTGKICYIEMPSVDIEASARFYGSVFGWSVGRRGDGSTSFDDTVGGVSGTWVTDRPPQVEPGLMVHIMVADIARIIQAIQAAGGQIVTPVDPNSPEVFAHFRDPAGNVLGIYQQPGLVD